MRSLTSATGVRNIRSRLARGSLWISGGRIADNLLSLVTTVVLARLLMPADFGLVALAATMLAIVTVVTDVPVTWALISKKDPTSEHYHAAWTISMTRGVILAAAFCLLSWPMAAVYNEPSLIPVMCVMSAGLLLNGIYNVRLTMMQKKLIFWQGAALTFAKAVATTVCSITVAVVYQSYWALVAGAVAGQLTSTLLSYVLFPFRPRLSFKHASELLSFSIWLTLGQAINTLNERLDHLLIGGILGRAALGYYSVGSNLAVMPSRESIRPIAHTLFPALSAVSDDPERLRRGYQRAQALVTAIALPAGLGFALVADPAVRLALGENWIPAIPVVQVIGSIYAFATLGSLVGPLAMARGATQLLFKRSLQLLIIRLPMILSGMYLWGLVGLLYASAAAGLVGLFISMRMIRSLTGLPIRAQLSANSRCLTAAAIMAGTVLILQGVLPSFVNPRDQIMAIAASVTAGATAYLCSSWLLWLAAGRPAGPESEALEFARTLRVRLRERRSVE